MKLTILEDNFKQWGTWIDQPSNSQWLGHYARLAGLHGIIYPSCRIDSGFNIAVFPDNFVDSESSIKIVQNIEHVPNDLHEMNCRSFEFFKGDTQPENSVRH